MAFEPIFYEDDDKTREDLLEELKKSRASVDRLKRIISGQQKVLDAKKASRAKRDELEVRLECAATAKEEMEEHYQELETLNTELEAHVEELRIQNEELLEIQADLRDSEEKFRALTEASPAMVFFHQGGKLLYVNPAASTLTGYSQDELLDMEFSEIVAPEFRDIVKRRGQARLRGENPIPHYVVKIITNRGGGEKCIEISTTPMVYRGRPGVMAIAWDVTARKLAERELTAAKQQAELYVDLMAHDINNMHQVALGYLELALGMPPGEAQLKFLEKPVEVLNRSTQLIGNVRKLEKLRNGALKARVIDVCQVLADVEREYRAMPNKAIMLNINGHEHCRVRANELLYEVFANLVSNAIKHTGDRADIIVDLDLVNYDGTTYCRVMVEDDGPGIPDDFKTMIFNRALKGNSKAKGMGLGLYLVKSLVDSYGGYIWVEDRVIGQHSMGARFVVLLPMVEK